MELLAASDLKQRAVSIEFNTECGLAIFGKKYGDACTYYTVEIFFDADVKRRFSLATYSVRNGNVEEKFALDNVIIGGKPFDARKYLESKIDIQPPKVKKVIVKTPSKKISNTFKLKNKMEEEDEKLPADDAMSDF